MSEPRCVPEFQATLHVRPHETSRGPAVQIGGHSVATLDVDAADARLPFPVSFEEAAEALAKHPRLYFEPDGSFLLRHATEEACAWQLEGNLYDRGGQLVYVELRGSCRLEIWEQLLRACGWPQVAFMVQLSREAVFVDDPEFRRVWLLP